MDPRKSRLCQQNTAVHTTNTSCVLTSRETKNSLPSCDFMIIQKSTRKCGDRARARISRVSPCRLLSYHTRAISMNIVRATAWTLHDAAQKAKGRLCGKRAGSPAALG